MRALTRYIIVALFCLTAPHVFAQPDTLWSARISAAGNPAIYDASDHSSGDFIVVGETNPGIANSNFLLSRLGPSGSIMWTRTYGGPNSDAAYSCVEIPSGNMIVAGSGNNGSTILLMEISSEGDSLWSRTYGSGGMTCAYDIALLQDGNIAVAGFRLGLDNLHSDLWLLKCNTSGDTLWTRSFGGGETDIGYRIRERPDRTLVIGGYSKSNSAGDYDLWQLRTDSLGNALSSSLYGGTAPDICYDLSDGDSVVYLGGKTTVASSNIGYLAKTNGNGDSLWVRSYTNGGIEEQLRGVVARRSGGVICAGWSGSSWNNRQCWLLAINPDGSEDWHWSYGPVASGFYGINSVASGGYLAYGQVSESNVRKGYALRVSKSKISGSVVENGTGTPVVGARVGIVGLPQHVITDQNGEYQWGILNGTYDLTVSGSCITRDTLQSIVVPQDSMITVDFHVNRPHYVQLQSSINAVVQNHIQTSVPLQIANSGNGAMEFGITPETISPSSNWLSVAPDTGLIPAGDTLIVQVVISPDTTDNGTFDFQGSLHITTNSCPGNSETISVTAYVLDADDNTNRLPRSFSLSAFPNPFNPKTTITFSLPHTTRIKLSVYDVTGRCVALLADESLVPGTYRFPFNAGLLPSGLYFAHIESVLFSSTHKLMLIR